MLHKCKCNKKNSGFTLVEVLTSIAILSIVSVSLLRAFTVSATMNRIAHEMDAAKALAIETAERYRDDPYTSPSYTGYLSSYNNTEVSGKYILYYNGSFDKAKAWQTRINHGDAEEFAKGVSAYRVIITPTVNGSETISEYYYPTPAFNVTATNGATELTFTKVGDSDCELIRTPPIPNAPNSILFSTTSKTAMVPVLVDCGGIIANSTINVTNLIGKLRYLDPAVPVDEEMTAIVDVYLYNIPPSTSVDVVAEEGIATSNKISVGDQSMIDYTATIEVERLSDSRIIARYKVDKYWVEEVSP